MWDVRDRERGVGGKGKVSGLSRWEDGVAAL